MIEAPTNTAKNATDPAQQRLLLVTGLAGAGKSTVLAALEDMGWETIDNFPVRLLNGLVTMASGERTSAEQRGPLAIGFDTRTRGFVPAHIIALAKEFAGRAELAVSLIFMDCAGQELERRYNETRRRHPMAQGRPVHEAIAAERELLEPLRRWAEIVIDTTALSAKDLQDHIRGMLAPTLVAEGGAGGAPGEGFPLTLTLTSFGFARGMPPLADLVFDMRFLDNPHWVPELRELTGQDASVGEHIERDVAFAEAFGRIRDLVLLLLPRYQAQGKPYVHVAFGCTGGRHRSVYTTEQMAHHLREAGFSPTVRHRNLDNRAADDIEQDRRQ
jgi:RNase adapter protein RapZ